MRIEKRMEEELFQGIKEETEDGYQELNRNKLEAFFINLLL